MKKIPLLFLLMLTLLSANTNSIYGAALEKGNPVADFHHDFTHLPNGKRIERGGAYTALFMNRTLVTDYNVMIRNERHLSL